ncbi:hypothetical protein LJC40_03860 [Synergistaceae bacterium OttesenSCG-928-D05]|nr:hypothetical protein [Synergistaceae bacterium OttesenSCG-928-D05]
MGSRRSLSDTFMKDLKKEGVLHPILEFVQNDDTLCLAIRNNYINIYYRGGSLMKIFTKGPVNQKTYSISFNAEGYANKNKLLNTLGILGQGLPKADPTTREDVSKWVRDWCENIPKIKAVMDGWLAVSPKPEREFQQLIWRENNRKNDKFKKTKFNYYFVDVEYTAKDSQKEKGGRFDMLALRQPNDSENPAIVSLVEIKYGEAALSGESGLKEHVKDICKYLIEKSHKQDLIEQTRDLYEDQYELGTLLRGSKGTAPSVCNHSELEIEILFIFINIPPASEKLKEVLLEIKGCSEYKALLGNGINIKVAKPSGMGYGLYDDNICSLEEFIEELEQKNK